MPQEVRPETEHLTPGGGVERLLRERQHITGPQGDPCREAHATTTAMQRGSWIAFQSLVPLRLRLACVRAVYRPRVAGTQEWKRDFTIRYFERQARYREIDP